MIIKKIELINYRNYEKLVFYPKKGINLIWGQNGTGKTNILEAIHYCTFGKSHRISTDRNAILSGKNDSVCEVTIRKNETLTKISMKLSINEKKIKSFYIADKKITRYSELIGVLQCVLFSPEDLNVIKETPQQRRKLIDMMISQMSTSYFVALQQYNKILEERNTLIRNYKITGSIDVMLVNIYNEELAKQAETIIAMRKKTIQWLDKLARFYYGKLSHSENEKLEIMYICCIKDQKMIKEEYIEMLKDNYENDIKRGTTENGIHREDIRIQLNGRDIKTYGSQGQIRSTALCIKLSQLDMFYQQNHDYPILLLDDVMSELDAVRRNALLEMTKNIQTFITCTDETMITEIPEINKLHVINKNGLAYMEGNAQIQDLQETNMEPDFT